MAAAKVDEVRVAIAKRILDDGLEPGDRLPAEPTLAAELGVGRNALREAMKILETQGIVEIRHGFGTYVGVSPMSSLAAGLRFQAERAVRGDLERIRELLDVRRILEVGLMERAIELVDENDLVELSATVDAMEVEAASGRYFPELDWQFHERLASSLGNTLIVELLGVFWRVFREIEDSLPRARYAPEEAAAWHRAIVDALIARDLDAARSAMQVHFADIAIRVA